MALPHPVFLLETMGVVCLLMSGCQPSAPATHASIEFTRLPPAGEGNPDIINPIEGRVTGARPGQRVVLFARSGMWYVQPLTEHPFTAIASDSKWKGTTHPGSAYAALLVDAGFVAPATINTLPKPEGAIRAVAVAEGPALVHPERRVVHFSGYDWEVRQTPKGSQAMYEAGNATVDRDGFLHMRITREGDRWANSQLILARSLGYGTYRFVVREISQLEPADVLAISTWDDSGPYREMDIEIGRWGESAGKNAQFLVQPYFVPANVVRFLAPEGRLTYSFDWEPGRVAFRTVRGSPAGAGAELVAAHTFTSGIPSPGSETVRLHLYNFYSRNNPRKREVEVIIEKFEYLP